jgi:small-conductance mechanosensitive channel
MEIKVWQYVSRIVIAAGVIGLVIGLAFRGQYAWAISILAMFSWLMYLATGCK